jgi:hypothetical protein
VNPNQELLVKEESHMNIHSKSMVRLVAVGLISSLSLAGCGAPPAQIEEGPAEQTEGELAAASAFSKKLRASEGVYVNTGVWEWRFTKSKTALQVKGVDKKGTALTEILLSPMPNRSGVRMDVKRPDKGTFIVLEGPKHKGKLSDYDLEYIGALRSDIEASGEVPNGCVGSYLSAMLACGTAAAFAGANLLADAWCLVEGYTAFEDCDITFS